MDFLEFISSRRAHGTADDKIKKNHFLRVVLGKIRTFNFQSRNLILYSIELRAPFHKKTVLLKTRCGVSPNLHSSYTEIYESLSVKVFKFYYVLLSGQAMTPFGGEGPPSMQFHY